MLCTYPSMLDKVFKVTYFLFLFQNPFYVRCIKPNEIKSPVSLNEQRVRHQVTNQFIILDT